MNVYFESKGTGDLNIKVDCMNLTETYSIEDIYFFRSQEYSYTRTSENNYNQFIDNTTNLTLPSKFEVSFDYMTTGAAANNEHRFFLMPRNLFAVNTQPRFALYWGNRECPVMEAGVRRNNSTSNTYNRNLPCNVYNTFKDIYNENNDSRAHIYLNGNYVDYYNLSVDSDYTTYLSSKDWCFCFHMWELGTVTVRNLKIKAL